ncbi:MAG TPA: CoA pyrophosphatase [Gemmatimonadales bacterium]|nr:CoA pyrophosphatase [Gemmatimonadales bacterium]
MLWRRLRIALALTGRLATLKERLANHPDTAAADPSLIWAAVAVLIAPDPDAILLIRRADRPGDPWSGHMALPGGRREPDDLDLLATAIRETREEVGIELDRGQLLGALDDVVPRNPVLPPIAVRPFAFLLPARPVLVLNHEVAATQWVSLEDLRQPGGYHLATLEIAGQMRDVQAYRLADAIVWGMTERILTAFLHHVNLTLGGS